MFLQHDISILGTRLRQVISFLFRALLRWLCGPRTQYGRSKEERNICLCLESNPVVQLQLLTMQAGLFHLVNDTDLPPEAAPCIKELHALLHFIAFVAESFITASRERSHRKYKTQSFQNAGC